MLTISKIDIDPAKYWLGRFVATRIFDYFQVD
jgi:hypothetical protein